MGFLNRIRSLLKKDEPSGFAISTKDLVIGYGSNIVVNKLSFRVRRGDIYAIVGLSGSGKSTILKYLVNLIRGTGDVNILGKSRSGSREHVAYSPQENSFFNELTILENIRLFSAMNSVNPTEGIERGKKLLLRLQMGGAENKKAVELSGGQKKRLNIILSILHKPKILVLDEPFAGLDFYNRRILWNFIQELKSKEKTTILLTTHLLDEAEKYCNRILVLKDGKRFSAGTVTEMLRNRQIHSVMELRFNYLSEESKEKIQRYVRSRKIRILDMRRRYGLFAFPGHAQRDRFLEFLKGNRIKYDVDSYRPPGLDDLFLLVTK